LNKMQKLRKSKQTTRIEVHDIIIFTISIGSTYVVHIV
jgi:hypothetical protein